MDNKNDYGITTPRFPRRVVCAAIRCDDGFIVSGVRHFSPDMRETMRRVYGEKYWEHEVEQGFIDQKGVFLTRTEAFILARENGQCPHLPKTGAASLFSEDLY